MFQWRGITTSDDTVESEGLGQGHARKQELRSLIITGPGVEIPFAIEIPLGALPVIFERHNVSIRNNGGNAPSDPVFYFYGWEKDDQRRLWEFGGDKIVLHEE